MLFAQIYTCPLKEINSEPHIKNPCGSVMRRKDLWKKLKLHVEGLSSSIWKKAAENFHKKKGGKSCCCCKEEKGEESFTFPTISASPATLPVAMGDPWSVEVHPRREVLVACFLKELVSLNAQRHRRPTGALLPESRSPCLAVYRVKSLALTGCCCKAEIHFVGNTPMPEDHRLTAADLFEWEFFFFADKNRGAYHAVLLSREEIHSCHLIRTTGALPRRCWIAPRKKALVGDELLLCYCPAGVENRSIVTGFEALPRSTLSTSFLSVAEEYALYFVILEYCTPCHHPFAPVLLNCWVWIRELQFSGYSILSQAKELWTVCIVGSWSLA